MDEYIDGKKVEPVIEKETGFGSEDYKSPVADTSKETREVAHELSMRPYRDFFNIPNEMYDSKLEEIISWAKQGNGSLEESLSKLDNLSSKMGSPSLGESKLEHLYRRVKILQSLSAIANGEF